MAFSHRRVLHASSSLRHLAPWVQYWFSEPIRYMVFPLYAHEHGPSQAGLTTTGPIEAQHAIYGRLGLRHRRPLIPSLVMLHRLFTVQSEQVEYKCYMLVFLVALILFAMLVLCSWLAVAMGSWALGERFLGLVKIVAGHVHMVQLVLARRQRLQSHDGGKSAVQHR